MLPKFPYIGSAKTTMDPWCTLGLMDISGEVGFDVSLNTGSRSLQATMTIKLVGHQLVIWWALEGQELLQKRMGLIRPRPMSIPATAFRAKALPVTKIIRSITVQLRTAYTQLQRSRLRIYQAFVKSFENTPNQNDRQPMNELFFSSA